MSKRGKKARRQPARRKERLTPPRNWSERSPWTKQARKRESFDPARRDEQPAPRAVSVLDAVPISEVEESEGRAGRRMGIEHRPCHFNKRSNVIHLSSPQGRIEPSPSASTVSVEAPPCIVCVLGIILPRGAEREGARRGPRPEQMSSSRDRRAKLCTGRSFPSFASLAKESR